MIFGLPVRYGQRMFRIFAVKTAAMQYMIIEKFRPGRAEELYRRFEEKGRMLPEGVSYINSWINDDVTVCYQLMEAGGPEKIQEWTGYWNDLADFEVVPVISSAEAKEKVFKNTGDEK